MEKEILIKLREEQSDTMSENMKELINCFIEYYDVIIPFVENEEIYSDEKIDGLFKKVKEMKDGWLLLIVIFKKISDRVKKATES